VRASRDSVNYYPVRNLCRFYRLGVQPHLFGGVLLMTQWDAAAGRRMAIIFICSFVAV
jgi:hypothetical protein